MAELSPDYKKLFLEEQRRRQAAESAQKLEQRKREEAEQAQERAEGRTRKTTLPEFLDACHNHLYSGLAVQNDMTLSTQGDPANANNKLRPERLRLWDNFPAQQAAIWEDLMNCDLILERHFTSIHTLEESGEGIRRRMMSSELDLHVFQRHTVEEPVCSVVERLYQTWAMRKQFGLQGSVKFENHANTLSAEPQLEEGVENMTVSGTRRRSPRLQVKTKQASSSDCVDPTASGIVATAKRVKTSRPRADQFCVYNASTSRDVENRVAAFIIEYKAPHKLPLGYIYEGLDDMELYDVLQAGETDAPRDRFRRLMAAVITQAFSYMVKIGLEYGCVCTGEASIFLRVPEDPRIVYYFLSVPMGDVGANTGWSPDWDGSNRLHLTAVGQMLAFTLQALKTRPRSQKWRAEAAAKLNNWEVVYDDLLDAIPLEDAALSSEYRPPRHDGFLRMSPIQLRRRKVPSSPKCLSPQNPHSPSDEEPDPDTPSRQQTSPHRVSRARKTASSSSSSDSHGEAHSGRYCTQDCLRGLVEGGLLDMSCPNVRDHGDSHHQINRPTFLALIRRQLSIDLDTDCKPVGVPGACGVLFRVRLRCHGYTVAAKCTPIDFVRRLRWEATIYERLRPIQGIHVPVHLGNIDLATPYFYEGITELVHMMFLGFGGKLISRYITTVNKPSITQQVDRAAQAIHSLGVLHQDLKPRNILWNEDTGQVIVVDFERAVAVEPRTVLGSISANRKRKRGSSRDRAKRGGNESSRFLRERQQAAVELQRLT